MNVDAIVPCFNEAERVADVLSVLSNSENINRIIFIDDGSTDGSSVVAKEFKKTNVIRLKKNHGKSEAVRIGLEHVNSKAVFLCDADITGLEEKHILGLINKHKINPNNLVVGMRQKQKSKKFYRFRVKYLPILEGERIILKTDLEKILNEEKPSGFELELMMNNYFKRNDRQIVTVLLDGVSNTHKLVKEKYGFIPMANEALELLQAYTKIYKRNYLYK
jgi:glycosyltransferase involved in cell wall biosynthesis